MKTNILLIDPNTDFHDSNAVIDGENYSPTLPVTGSTEDALRISKFLTSEQGMTAKNLFVSLDEHEEHDISHYVYWKETEKAQVEKKSNFHPHPMPYTPIHLKDLEEGYITTTDPEKFEHAYNYLNNLEKGGSEHWVFPLHCIKGSVGYKIFPVIKDAIDIWSKDKTDNLHVFNKGMNPDYEFFSPFGAEVIDENVPETNLNSGLVSEILDCDKLYVFGQALSHCVIRGVQDLVHYIEFSADNEDQAKKELSKIHLVLNMSSPVSGFELITKERIKVLESKGVTTIKL